MLACSSASAGSGAGQAGTGRWCVAKRAAVVAHQGALDAFRHGPRCLPALLCRPRRERRRCPGGDRGAHRAMTARCATGEQAGACRPSGFLRRDALLWPPADKFVDDAPRNRASPKARTSLHRAPDKQRYQPQNLNAGTVMWATPPSTCGTTVNATAPPPPGSAPGRSWSPGRARYWRGRILSSTEVLAALTAAEQHVVAGVLDGMDEQPPYLVEEVMLTVQGRAGAAGELAKHCSIP